MATKAVITRKCGKCGGTGDYRFSHGQIGTCTQCGGSGVNSWVNPAIKSLIVPINRAVVGDLVKQGEYDTLEVYRVAVRKPFEAPACSCECHKLYTLGTPAGHTGCLDCYWDHGAGANETLLLQRTGAQTDGLLRVDRTVPKPCSRQYTVAGFGQPAPVATGWYSAQELTDEAYARA
jgi:hypothetical protein